MSHPRLTSVPSVPRARQFNEEDWFLIDEALNRVSLALRKIEQRQKVEAEQTKKQQPDGMAQLQP